MRTTTAPDAAALVQRLARATNKTLDVGAVEHFTDLFRGFTPEVGAEVVRRLTTTDQFFPSEARIRHVAGEVLADRQRDGVGGMAPTSPAVDDIHPDVRRANLRVLREVLDPAFIERTRAALDQTGEPWGPHDVDEAVAGYVYDRVVAIAGGREPFPDPADSGRRSRSPYRHPACHDTGWVEHHDAAGNLFVEPCGQCNPVVARRHSDGHYDPGHWCDECSEVRRYGRFTGGDAA